MKSIRQFFKIISLGSLALCVSYTQSYAEVDIAYSGAATNISSLTWYQRPDSSTAWASSTWAAVKPLIYVTEANATANLYRYSNILDTQTGFAADGTNKTISLNSIVSDNATGWHLYYASNDLVLNVKNVNLAANSTSLLIRTASGNSGAIFNSSGKIDIKGGTAAFGTSGATGGIGTNTGLKVFTANQVELAAGTNFYVGASTTMSVTDLKVSGANAKVNFYPAAEIATTPPQDISKAKVSVGTLNLAATTGAIINFGADGVSNSTVAHVVDLGELKLNTTATDTGFANLNFNTTDYATTDGGVTHTGLKIGKISLLSSGAASLNFLGTMTEVEIASMDIASTSASAIRFASAHSGFTAKIGTINLTKAAGGVTLSTDSSTTAYKNKISGFSIDALNIDITDTTSGTARLDISGTYESGEFTTNITTVDVKNIKNSTKTAELIFSKGVGSITNLNFHSTLSNDVTLKIHSPDSGWSMLSVDNLTVNAGAKATILLDADTSNNVYSGISVGNLTATGAGTSLTIKSIVSDMAELEVYEKLLITNGAAVKFGGDQYDLVYGILLKDVEITGGGQFTAYNSYFSHASAGTIKISGANSKMEILAGTTGEFGALNNVDISDGGLLILRRVSGSPQEFITNLTMTSGATGTAGATMKIGDSTTYPVGWVEIKNALHFKASSTTATTTDSLASILTLNTAQGTGETDVRAKIAATTLDNYASASITSNSKVTTIASINAGLGSRLTLGGTTGFEYRVLGNFISSANELILNNSVLFHVVGNFTNDRQYMDNLTPKGLEIAAGSGSLAASIVVDGYIQNNGAILFNKNSTTGTINVSAAGLVGTDNNSAYRVSLNGSYNGGLVNITFTGNDIYMYNNRIHDFGSTSANPTSLTGKIGITKNGAGTQFLVGQNYYRGDTVVNSGALYMRADGVDNTARLGIGKLILNGGRFGAAGAVNTATKTVSSVGTVKATSLTWSNLSVIDVFVDSTNVASLLDISGAVTKALGDVATVKYSFYLNVLDSQIDLADDYRLVVASDFSQYVVSDFEYTTNDARFAGNYIFELRDDGLYLTLIPEPSTYAAILGILALGLVYLRRRKA